jgi:hypothetical protein
VVPEGKRPNDDDEITEETQDADQTAESLLRVTLDNSHDAALTNEESLQDLKVLSLDFCKKLLDTLHELFPDEVSTLKSQLEGTDSDDNMAVLQQWLFFGTLQTAFECLEVPVDLELYVDRTGEVPVLSTKQLKDDLELWEAIELSRKDGKLGRQRRLIEMLVDVAGFATSITDRADSDKIADFLTAVHTLCITLEIKGSQIYGGVAGSLGSRNKHLGDKLVAAGWCPRQTQIILDSYVLIMVYYIYLCGPPKKPHVRKDCSIWTCKCLYFRFEVRVRVLYSNLLLNLTRLCYFHSIIFLKAQKLTVKNQQAISIISSSTTHCTGKCARMDRFANL